MDHPAAGKHILRAAHRRVHQRKCPVSRPQPWMRGDQVDRRTPDVDPVFNRPGFPGQHAGEQRNDIRFVRHHRHRHRHTRHGQPHSQQRLPLLRQKHPPRSNDQNDNAYQHPQRRRFPGNGAESAQSEKQPDPKRSAYFRICFFQEKPQPGKKRQAEKRRIGIRVRKRMAHLPTDQKFRQQKNLHQRPERNSGDDNPGSPDGKAQENRAEIRPGKKNRQNCRRNDCKTTKADDTDIGGHRPRRAGHRQQPK